MNEPSERPISLLGDIALSAVEAIEHVAVAGFVGHGVVGLEGAAQQYLGRGSHVIRISGQVMGETYREDLEALQDAASSGAEMTFAADIVTALDLQSVVVRPSENRERLMIAPGFFYVVFGLFDDLVDPPRSIDRVQDTADQHPLGIGIEVAAQLMGRNQPRVGDMLTKHHTIGIARDWLTKDDPCSLVPPEADFTTLRVAQ